MSVQVSNPDVMLEALLTMYSIVWTWYCGEGGTFFFHPSFIYHYLVFQLLFYLFYLVLFYFFISLLSVGDVDQLPPVGPGTVLSAAIQSGMIPVIDLRQIFRQAQESQIVTVAHSIQQGLFPQLADLPISMLKVRFLHL